VFYNTPEKLEPLLWAVEQTWEITQREDYHPEIYVHLHLLQCFYIAVKETRDIDIIVAALVHDVGKVGGSHGHEKRSVDMLECHCSEKTLWLIEQHIKIWSLLTGQMKKRSKVQNLMSHPWFLDLILLARIDKMGRNLGRTVYYDKEEIINTILEAKIHNS